MLSTYLILGLVVFIAMVALIWIAFLNFKSRMSLYHKGSVEDAIAAFKINTDSLLILLGPPHSCDKGAESLKLLKRHYSELLKRANRYKENSETFQKIYTKALEPVLDQIEVSKTTRECFKNAEYKRAFDQFITAVQNNSRLHPGK